MDPGRSPQRVLKAHSSNEVAHLLADPRSARRGAGLPSPVSGKAHSMPAHDGLGSDNGYGVKNVRTATIEPNEQGTAGPVEMHPAWRALLQNIELMPQDQDFSFEPLARLEAVAQHAEEKKGNCHHRPGSCSDSVRAATQADGVCESDRSLTIVPSSCLARGVIAGARIGCADFFSRDEAARLSSRNAINQLSRSII